MGGASSLPWVLAGPMLRRCTPYRWTCWLALSRLARVRVRSLLHGSRRRRQHPGGDGLVEADRLLAKLVAQRAWRPEQGCSSAPSQSLPAWPSMLVMSGVQIYADAVAGPMLHAIHQAIARCGLPDEALAGVSEHGGRGGATCG